MLLCGFSDLFIALDISGTQIPVETSTNTSTDTFTDLSLKNFFKTNP